MYRLPPNIGLAPVPESRRGAEAAWTSKFSLRVVVESH